MLLAEIVERVSGMSFAAFAEKRLFEPLGMQDTHVNDDTYRVIKNRVIGYNPREEGGYYHFHRRSPHYGGSGVHSTIEDLYKWDQNFLYSHIGWQGVDGLDVKHNEIRSRQSQRCFWIGMGRLQRDSHCMVFRWRHRV